MRSRRFVMDECYSVTDAPKITRIPSFLLGTRAWPLGHESSRRLIRVCYLSTDDRRRSVLNFLAPVHRASALISSAPLFVCCVSRSRIYSMHVGARFDIYLCTYIKLPLSRLQCALIRPNRNNKIYCRK
jgi:hypothetical protein